jgi:hypothetical protein
MTAPQIKDAWEVPLTTTFDLPAPVVTEGIWEVPLPWIAALLWGADPLTCLSAFLQIRPSQMD